MTATTKRLPRQPVPRAHCGECEHYLVTDGRYMWCDNGRCPQHREKFVFQAGGRIVARSVPTLEIA